MTENTSQSIDKDVPQHKEGSKFKESDEVRTIIDRFLKNELINNPYIPDFIERKLYANVIKLVIGIMKETVESSKIDVLGHRISFKLEPIKHSEEFEKPNV